MLLFVALLNGVSGSNLLRKFGAVVQLGERYVRNVEVMGSSPICSTNSAEGGIDPERVKNSTNRRIFGEAKGLVMTLLGSNRKLRNISQAKACGYLLFDLFLYYAILRSS